MGESPKYERAAMKFLRRYLDEKEQTLKDFAKVVRGLEQREFYGGKVADPTDSDSSAQPV